MNRENRLLIAVGALLALATVVVYAQVYDDDYVDFDDRIYVHQNPGVSEGLTWEGTVANFTEAHAAYWLPLTWTSLALDVSLWGVDAGAMKLTNLALHVISTLLLLVLFRRMTGQLWPSALVAAMFALHPLHVESVAWVTERKDALSAVFWMLTLLAYERYARRPSVLRIALVAVPFALGLLSKPSLVVLPCVLLLLDYWPLNRIRREERLLPAWRPTLRAVLEKLPLFGLSLAAGLVVMATQSDMGGREVAGWLPGQTQATMAFEAFGHYLLDTLWPSGLAALYPVPTTPPPVLGAAAAGLALLAVTGLVVWKAPRRPYLLVGWLWFVGTLLPVIGIFFVGIQARADRWMYIPMVGLSMMLAWGLRDLALRWPRATRPLGVAAGAVVVAWAAAAFVQVGYWQDTRTLFERAVEVTEGNYYAYDRLAQEHGKVGRLDEAVEYGFLTLRYAPWWSRPRRQLADVFESRGNRRAAQALRAVPNAVWNEPRGPSELALALVRGGLFERALPFLEAALRAEPRAADLHSALAVVLGARGDADGSLRHYERAVDIEPRLYSSVANMAWLLATGAKPTKEQLDKATRSAQRGLGELRSIEPALLDALAAAHAAAGRFDRAVENAEEALAVAKQAGMEYLIAPIQARLERYRRGEVVPVGSRQWEQP